jgi:hypothetical protein
MIKAFRSQLLSCDFQKTLQTKTIRLIRTFCGSKIILIFGESYVELKQAREGS